MTAMVHETHLCQVCRVEWPVAPDERQEWLPAKVTYHDESDVVRVADMGPIERAYAEAMHEDCDSSIADGHPLTAHEPWSGGDLEGVETWPSFVARLARHGLSLALAQGKERPNAG